jgi:NAD(P)H-dependent FMN reductase
MMSVLAVLGSSRSNGNTRIFLDRVLQGRKAALLDLSQFDLSHYDYDLPMDRDDFPQIAEQLRASSTLLFATPVYWYSMSSRMKVLFDRFTDLLDRQISLEGKNVFLLATGTKPVLPEGFEVPFRETAAYLGMHYQGSVYACMREAGQLSSDAKEAADRFSQRLFA